MAGWRAAGQRRSGIDVLVVSLGATGGLRTADAELCDALGRSGASVALTTAKRPPEVRTLMLTDLAWALAARRAARAAIVEHAPKAVLYSSVTAALLWPREGAIRFDSIAAGNRPGRHGLWQRPLERRRLSEARLLLPYSDVGVSALPSRLSESGRALALPVPVEPSGDARSAPRDVAAITYAANPLKKGLDVVLAAWERARQPGETLLVAGAPESELRRAGISLPGEGVQLTGMLAPAQYRALLRRARVFVCAPRREDHGIAQLEALADGCMLVSTPAPGPYAALPIASSLDARLVGEDLHRALRCALDSPLPDYPERAMQALLPLRRGAVDRLIAEQVLPRLLRSADEDRSPA